MVPPRTPPRDDFPHEEPEEEGWLANDEEATAEEAEPAFEA